VIFHEKEKDFIDAIKASSAKMGIREVYIEKDYWVTYVLKKLALSKYKNKVIFKGGTSLVKAYKLTERFSEDVDLALLPEGDETGNKIKNTIKGIESTLMASPFQKNSDYIGNSKGSKFRRTAHKYPRFLELSNFGYASDNLILEINSFTNPSPYKKMSVSSLLAEFLRGIDDKMIDEYELQDIEVNVLDITRTFTEKIMGIIRAGYSENPMDSLREKIRHIYDLHKLLTTVEIQEFLTTSSQQFSSILSAVKLDDQKNVEFQGDWMNKSPLKSFLFNNPKAVLEDLEDYYLNDFSSLVYGELPTISELVDSMNQIKEAMSRISVSQK
jgi:predicted nucleotidyltransferase component of viral defense system